MQRDYGASSILRAHVPTYSLNNTVNIYIKARYSRSAEILELAEETPYLTLITDSILRLFILPVERLPSWRKLANRSTLFIQPLCKQRAILLPSLYAVPLQLVKFLDYRGRWIHWTGQSYRSFRSRECADVGRGKLKSTWPCVVGGRDCRVVAAGGRELSLKRDVQFSRPDSRRVPPPTAEIFFSSFMPIERSPVPDPRSPIPDPRSPIPEPRSPFARLINGTAGRITVRSGINHLSVHGDITT